MSEHADPPPMSCGAVLFDLDGVLVDSRACVERHWSLWAKRHRLEPAQILAVAHGRRSEEVIRLTAPGLDAAAEARQLDEEEARDFDGVFPSDGAAELVRELPAESWAIVTSGMRPLAEARLRHVGLPIPTCLVTAEDVSTGKPDPEGYLTAAARVGVQPGDCVVVEDAEPGIAAARAAGMAVIALKTTAPAEQLATADALVDSLSRIDVAVRTTDDGSAVIELSF